MNPNINVNPNTYAMPSVPQPPKNNRGPIFMVVVLSIILVLSFAFGFWAFFGMQENKTDLDKKISEASAAAVKEAQAAKDAEFAETEKDPYKTYSGSATFGSLSFSYPKTWSVYLEENDSGTVLDYYAHPNMISGLEKDNSFAFRAQIISNDYATEAEKLQKLASSSKVTITAFSAKSVPSVLGLRAVGEISSGKQGIMIILPQRDKTIKLWTESNEFSSDFDKLSETINFVP